MTVMYSFCLCLPVRLGAIIVAITCALESSACLGAAVMGYTDHDGTVKFMNDLFTSYLLEPCESLFKAFENDPDSHLLGIIIALSIHLVSCLFLVIGAFRCSVILIYPFVGLDFIRLCILSSSLIIMLLVIKTNTLTLGTVIACSIGGGFLMLYLWYQWFCVVSLCQIIREVNRMDRVAPLTYPPNISGKMKMAGAYTSAFYSKTGISGPDHKNYFGLPPPAM